MRSTKAVVEKVEESGAQTGRFHTIRLRLYDLEVPKEYWLLELSYEGNTWKPKTGFKYINGKLAFDLFKDEFLAGTRIMGSMKPYLQKALTAYSDGKDFRTVFSAQGATTRLRSGHLVGQWRRVDTTQRLTTNITFRQNGTYVGSIEQNGKLTATFSGKWSLESGFLNYEYTASSGIQIPVGTKDRDRVITLTREQYTIQNALGLHETYRRIE